MSLQDSFELIYVLFYGVVSYGPYLRSLCLPVAAPSNAERDSGVEDEQKGDVDAGGSPSHEPTPRAPIFWGPVGAVKVGGVWRYMLRALELLHSQQHAF